MDKSLLLPAALALVLAAPCYLLALSLWQTLQWLKKCQADSATQPFTLAKDKKKRRLIIFLSGVSNYEKAFVSLEQQELLSALAESWQADVLLRQFPFCPSTRPKPQVRRVKDGLILLSLRNFWQFIFLQLSKSYRDLVRTRIEQTVAGAEPDELLFVCSSLGLEMLSCCEIFQSQAASRLASNRVFLLSIGGVCMNYAALGRLESALHFVSPRDHWSRFFWLANSLCFPGKGLGEIKFGNAKHRIIESPNCAHMDYLKPRNLPLILGETSRMLELESKELGGKPA